MAFGREIESAIAGHTCKKSGLCTLYLHSPSTACYSGAFYWRKTKQLEERGQEGPLKHCQPSRVQSLMEIRESHWEGQMEYIQHSLLVGISNLPSPKLNSRFLLTLSQTFTIPVSPNIKIPPTT